MQTVIHLSDLHISLRKEESQRAKAIFARIACAFPGIPVLITGDLTDSATKPQFKEARELLDELAKTNPILAVPGNHDYAWKGNILREDGWKNWVEYLGSPLGWKRKETPWMELEHEPSGIEGLGVWQVGPCAYFGIDSGDPKDKQISARGYVSEKLAEALGKSLREHAGKLRVVLLHHHPFTGGFFTKLHGAERLLQALQGNCEILMFGHNHKYGIWRGERGIPLTVASHKSTGSLSGDCLMITVIEIGSDGSFRHRLEIV